MGDEVKSTAVATRAAMSRAEMVEVLGSSLYPGASAPSIALALNYCEAARLDPMQKPVHIVPMYDRNQGGMRDVIMPGIGLYRTQAARTGQFAGMSEAEFGPMICQEVGGVEVTYPEWCRVTAKRQLANGFIAEFTAVEYWLENYAVKGGKAQSIAPNAMWMKRTRGQLAKCAMAQAIRMGFPEVGAAPTAEEMEGKSYIDHSEINADGTLDQRDRDLRKVTKAPDAPVPSDELKTTAFESAKLGRVGFDAWWKSITERERLSLAKGVEKLILNCDVADERMAAAAELEKAAADIAAADKQKAAASAATVIDGEATRVTGPINADVNSDVGY